MPMVMKALAASQSLYKHLPSFNWPQCRHEINAGKKEALGFYNAAPTEQHSHSLLRSKKERISLPKLNRLAEVRRYLG
jgi:hypothetical protein